MKKSLLSLALFAFHPLFAVEDAPTAAAAPVDTPAVDVAPADMLASAAPATVSIEVPAQHQSLLERAAALLSKDVGWVKDNIEAGLTHLEDLFKKS